LIAEPSSLEGGQAKLSATIVHILFPEQVKHIRTLPCWPLAFDRLYSRESEDSAASASKGDTTASKDVDGDKSEDDGSDDELFQNTNRVNYDSYEEENESEEDEEDDEEKDG
jgi:hypothetical protein